MSPDPQPDPGTGARYVVPQHVVFRAFAAEMVLLNLETGRYHGLNLVAGRMLEILDKTGDPGEVIDRVTEEWNVDRARVGEDLTRLCDDLLERGLIELAGSSGT